MDKYIQPYEDSLNDREKLGYQIAQDHFRDTNSFDLFKSNGFLAFVKKEKEKEKEKSQ